MPKIDGPLTRSPYNRWATKKLPANIYFYLLFLLFDFFFVKRIKIEAGSRIVVSDKIKKKKKGLSSRNL